MSEHAEHRTVRRVVLPGGRTIEVRYHDIGAATRATARPEDGAADATVEGLHVCPACRSRLVCPVAWEEAGPDHWDVTLRCPNCEWLGSGTFDEELVARFDEELDRATEAIVRDHQRLMRANMEDEVGRFLAALAADQIWPMDF